MKVLLKRWLPDQMGTIIRAAKADISRQRKLRKKVDADKVDLSKLDIFLDSAGLESLRASATRSADRVALELDLSRRTPSGGIARVGADLYVQLMTKAGKGPAAWWKISKEWYKENEGGP